MRSRKSKQPKKQKVKHVKDIFDPSQVVLPPPSVEPLTPPAPAPAPAAAGIQGNNAQTLQRMHQHLGALSSDSAPVSEAAGGVPSGPVLPDQDTATGPSLDASDALPSGQFQPDEDPVAHQGSEEDIGSPSGQSLVEHKDSLEDLFSTTNLVDAGREKDQALEPLEDGADAKNKGGWTTDRDYNAAMRDFARLQFAPYLVDDGKETLGQYHQYADLYSRTCTAISTPSR